MNNENILAVLKKVEKIALFIHINPDADAVGAACALQYLINKFGHKAYCFSEQPLSEKLLNIAGAEFFNTEESDKYDLGVIVDCSEVSRIGTKCAQVLAKCATVALIDHHVAGSSAGIDFSFSDSTAASATQVIYYLLKDFDASLIDKRIAENLYAGVLTDSGGFLFNSVKKATMDMVADLYSYDINAAEISQKLMRDNKKAVFDLKIRALSEAYFFNCDTIGIVVFTKKMFAETGTTEQDTENIINEIINIREVSVAIAVSEIADKAYKVSIRSKNGVSAFAIAKCFGGGGHNEAAGCRIYGYFIDCMHKLVEAATDIMRDD